jgi:hypothetical protein
MKMTDKNPFKSKIGGSGSLSADSGRGSNLVATPEATTTEQAEVSPLKASEKVALMRSSQADQKKKEQLERLSSISSLDWKSIPPPMLAQLLVNMPFKGQSGEPDFYLEPWQAMVFAIRCYELELSPFSNEVWFNPKNNKTNVSFEGKLKLARKNGLNLSPPICERIPADTTKPLVAYKATITTPSGKCEYTATLKERKVGTSPVWRDKPEHMLQLRASEKCLSFATGIGTSELMGEGDLQVGKEAEKFMASGAPVIESTEFKPAPMEEK